MAIVNVILEWWRAWRRGDLAAVTLVGLVAGQVYPMRAKRVRATGTTATNLVGMW